MSHEYIEDLDRTYVSEYDAFLQAFDEKHPKSASQRKEIEKHQRISEKRDNPLCNDDEASII
jgi:hypothetical protein